MLFQPHKSNQLDCQEHSKSQTSDLAVEEASSSSSSGSVPCVSSSEPDLPEPPEEPLQGDCCGTGCSPCVFDIYQEELTKWKQLSQMTPEERAARAERKQKGEAKNRLLPVALSKEQYRDFQIIKMKEVCENMFLFEFALPPLSVLGVDIGQHMTLRVKKDEDGYLTRQYTPISKPDQQGKFSVVVKLYEDGAMSRHVSEWRPGSVATWRGPFGDFHYFPNKYHHILMLACGTGIAPMVQIARAAVENEETFVRCLYACKTQHQILVKQELNAFAEFWNFTILYALSRSSPESVASNPGMLSYGDKVEYGRISKEMVERETRGMEESEGQAGERGDIVLICGTKSFDKDMINFVTKGSSRKVAFFKF